MRKSIVKRLSRVRGCNLTTPSDDTPRTAFQNNSATVDILKLKNYPLGRVWGETLFHKDNFLNLTQEFLSIARMIPAKPSNRPSNALQFLGVNRQHYDTNRQLIYSTHRLLECMGLDSTFAFVPAITPVMRDYAFTVVLGLYRLIYR